MGSPNTQAVAATPVSEDKVYYMYTDCTLHKCQCGTRATIAAKKVGNAIQFGIAICAVGDNFEREKGRQIALKRLQEGFASTTLKEDYFKANGGEEKGVISFLSNLSGSFDRNPKKWWRKVDYYTKNVAAPF